MKSKTFVIKPFDISLSPYVIKQTEAEAVESLKSLGYYCNNINDYKTIMNGILSRHVYIFDEDEAKNEIANNGEYGSLLAGQTSSISSS